MGITMLCLPEKFVIFVNALAALSYFVQNRGEQKNLDRLLFFRVWHSYASLVVEEKHLLIIAFQLNATNIWLQIYKVHFI